MRTCHDSSFLYLFYILKNHDFDAEGYFYTEKVENEEYQKNS
jgi:hypothetical protein